MQIPIFLISELNRNPETTSEIMDNMINSMSFHPWKRFDEDVKREIKNGTIKSIDSKHLFLNIISMAIFPFIGKPVLKRVGEFDDESYSVFINERKKTIAKFVIDAIKIEGVK